MPASLCDGKKNSIRPFFFHSSYCQVILVRSNTYIYKGVDVPLNRYSVVRANVNTALKVLVTSLLLALRRVCSENLPYYKRANKYASNARNVPERHSILKI